MNSDNLLSSLSEYIAYWYTSTQDEKYIIFPIKQSIKEKAAQLFEKRYQDADIIISGQGQLYKISKEISCQRNVWSYIFYLDDIKENYRLRRICKNILPYDLKASNREKIKKIIELKIPCEIMAFEVQKNQIKKIEELLSPYLTCLTYISRKNKCVVAYPDVLCFSGKKVIILISQTHHFDLKKHAKKIKDALFEYKEIDITKEIL